MVLSKLILPYLRSFLLSSSNNKLILDALRSNNSYKKISTNHTYFRELLNSFKNENNILFTNNSKTNKLFTNENYLATLFDFKDKELILRSYLLNNDKSLDIEAYEEINKGNKLDKNLFKLGLKYFGPFITLPNSL